MNLRYPDLSGSPTQQVNQLRDYLFYLVDELQFNQSSIQREISSERSAVSSSSTIISTGGGGESKTPLEVFNSIKDLIISSADIVSAYSKIITEDFEGEYLAISDFGAYAETIRQRIEKSEKGITQSFDDISLIASDIEGLGSDISQLEGDISDSVAALRNEVNIAIGGVDSSAKEALAYIKETKAYIKHGKLDNGRYGIEVGQEDNVNGNVEFKAFARFTADRLSFFDSNGTEAAYISQNQLIINNAVFKYSVAVGELVTKILTNGDIIERWA